MKDANPHATADAFVSVGPSQPATASRSEASPAHDLAVSLMQLHILYANRHDLMPSEHLDRVNAFATKLATFLDAISSHKDFFDALAKLEQAVDVLSREPQKNCTGTSTPDCQLAGRDVCVGTSDCVATKIKDPETLALLDLHRSTTGTE